MCVNNLSTVALDSAAAGIEPAISSRKSNALTTTQHVTLSIFSLISLFNCKMLLAHRTLKRGRVKVQIESNILVEAPVPSLWMFNRLQLSACLSSQRSLRCQILSTENRRRHAKDSPSCKPFQNASPVVIVFHYARRQQYAIKITVG